jgi:hypothetical protein
MPYRAARLERVFLLRWTSPPTLADVKALARDVAAAHASLGQRVAFIAVVPSEVGMPDPEARDAFNEATPEVVAHCASLDLVVEGTGVTQMLVRTLVRGMSIALRGHVRTGVHASLDDALTKLADDGLDVSKTKASARAQGLVDPAR